MAQSFLANLFLNIVVPVVIMTRFTDELGALPALLIALAFPLGYGLWDWQKERKLNVYSALGIVSVLLTGLIGVLALSAAYLAFKEAALPLLVALVFAFSSFTRNDATTKLLQQVLDVEGLHAAYKKKGFRSGFRRPIAWARWAFVGSFVFSAVANYVLTITVVTAEPATSEFTQQVGQITALAFPIIALPVFIVLIGTIYFLFWHIKKVTGDYTTFLAAHIR